MVVRFLQKLHGTKMKHIIVICLIFLKNDEPRLWQQKYRELLRVTHSAFVILDSKNWMMVQLLTWILIIKKAKLVHQDGNQILQHGQPNPFFQSLLQYPGVFQRSFRSHALCERHYRVLLYQKRPYRR